MHRSNEFARQTTGEAGKAAQTRAQLFDITFLMLCHIIQLHGMEVSRERLRNNHKFLCSCLRTNFFLSFCKTRKKDTVLHGLLVGRSYLTHSFLMKKEESSICVACNIVIPVKNILIECAALVEVRNRYFEERSLHSLFRNVNREKIFDHLTEMGMFYEV